MLKGKNGTSFPCKWFTCKKNSIKGAKVGDVVYSYYTVDGVNHISWGVKIATSGVVSPKAFADFVDFEDEKDVKFGFKSGEEINWAIEINGKYFKLNITKEWKENNLPLAEAEVTTEEIELKNNLYWTMPPIWTNEAEQKIFTPEAYEKLIMYGKFKPYRAENYRVEVIKGFGTYSKKAKFPKYSCSKKDKYLGEIVFNAYVDAYVDCGTKDTVRTFKFVFDKAEL